MANGRDRRESVTREIRLYVEGGGPGAQTKARFRQGLGSFFSDLRESAREKRIKWNIIACGGRDKTFENFTFALVDHADAFNILLVDSETPVNNPPWLHLNDNDGWSLTRALEEQCHLMTQVMETWFIADIEALKRFYRQGFNENAIPRNRQIENIPKTIIYDSLRNATHNTQPGEYKKIHHAVKLLEYVDASKIREIAPHCNRLFETISQKIHS
jgi:hypothetical protein